MAYMTIQPQDMGGFDLMSMFGGKKAKKKAKKAAKKAEEADKGIGGKMKDVAAGIVDTSDPSARDKKSSGGGIVGMMGSIPEWTIYAGAGAVVLFLFIKSRR